MAKPKTPTGGNGHRRAGGGKSTRQRLLEETGKALKDLGEFERQYRGNPRKQWEMVVRKMDIPALTGLERESASRTKTLYRERGEELLRDLPQIGMHLQNLREFSPKHVRALVEHWKEQDDDPSTIANLVTVMRRLLVWIGKPGALAAVDNIVRDADIGDRTYVVTTAKTLRSKGFSREELFETAAAKDKIFGLQVKMNVLFGLRRRESMFLNPSESDENGERLRVYRGTKGRRSRYVTIETDEQRAALAEAKAATYKYCNGVLTWPRLSENEAIARYKHFAREIGLTKKGYFQTTPHGLRHEFACDKYFRLTGYLAQVESGLAVDPELDRGARKVLAEELGHGRIEVCGAYISSNRVVVSQADKRTKALNERFLRPEVREQLREAGITCLRLVGKNAAGAADPAADTLCCYEGELLCEEAELAHLTDFLMSLVGGPCTLVPLTNGLRARADGLEVI